MSKRVTIIVLMMVLAFFVLPKIALAYECQSGYIALQVPIPVPGGQNDFCVSGFPDYVQRIYNFFISVVGILAVIMMMYGGFQWLVAGGNPSKISIAKVTILSALAGLALMLSSYLILNLINPDLTKFSLDINQWGTITGQDAPGGESYCSKTTKLAGGILGETAKCGVKYNLEGSSTSFCKGAVCDDGLCFSGNTDTCIKSYSLALLEGVKTYGYSPKDLLHENDIRIREGKVGALGGKAVCGWIFFWNGVVDDFLYVGTYCGDSQICVIDPAGGYNITKTRNSISIKDEDTVVGSYNIVHCY
ncbi:hypothetical protein GYA54_00620 [Candidatus Kuenenbacteria bacterium]|nr:hypothetical protein [Candidatus Kuenenbacteria bacterium]